MSRFQIAKSMGPTWGPSGSCRPQMGPMLAPWTLLSDILSQSQRCGTYHWLIARHQYCTGYTTILHWVSYWGSDITEPLIGMIRVTQDQRIFHISCLLWLTGTLLNMHGISSLIGCNFAQYDISSLIGRNLAQHGTSSLIGWIGPLSIYDWVRSQPIREDVIYVTSSLIGSARPCSAIDRKQAWSPSCKSFFMKIIFPSS